MKNQDKLYTDKCLESILSLKLSILKEHNNQMDKWGIQSHTLSEWVLYTTEELGELSKAISAYMYRDGSKHDCYKEAIQLATLALKIAEMIKDE